ncbi:hypothetical protein Tco_0332826 [Tanacetum coccineum]
MAYSSSSLTEVELSSSLLETRKPSITEDGVTRLKEYVELTPAEAIQADCDIKAINIILQGLPTEIYALVSQHRVAKDLWEKIKLLMQGTSLIKQETSINQSFQTRLQLSCSVVQKGDDPIDAIIKLMSFLTAVVTSRFSYTNNLIRTSSITLERVILQSSELRPKRKRDETWFNDLVLLVQASCRWTSFYRGCIAFLADPGLLNVQKSQTNQNCSHGQSLKEWSEHSLRGNVLDSTLPAQQDVLILSMCTNKLHSDALHTVNKDLT